MERNQKIIEKVRFNIIVNKKVVKDINNAIEYYNNQSEGLGDRFENALDEYINSLEINPYFKIRYDTVRIQAVLHTSRSIKSWQE